VDIIELKHNKEYIVANVNLHGYECARSYIVDNIAHVEVIKPFELRCFAREKIDDIMTKYKKTTN